MIEGKRWSAVTALLYWLLLPVSVQLWRAALSCHVVVGAGSLYRGGSSEVEAFSVPTHLLFFELLFPACVLVLQPTSLLLLLFSLIQLVFLSFLTERVMAGSEDKRAAAAP